MSIFIYIGPNYIALNNFAELINHAEYVADAIEKEDQKTFEYNKWLMCEEQSKLNNIANFIFWEKISEIRNVTDKLRLFCTGNEDVHTHSKEEITRIRKISNDAKKIRDDLHAWMIDFRSFIAIFGCIIGAWGIYRDLKSG